MIIYNQYHYHIDYFFRNKIKQANESIDFGEAKEFYKRIFSSLIELNAVFKLYPDKDEAALNDPELKFDLLFEVYDELDNLVRYNHDYDYDYDYDYDNVCLLNQIFIAFIYD